MLAGPVVPGLDLLYDPVVEDDDLLDCPTKLCIEGLETDDQVLLLVGLPSDGCPGMVAGGCSGKEAANVTQTGSRSHGRVVL